MSKTIETSKENLIADYDEIMSYSKTSVVVQNEWSDERDFFRKLSMYDNTFTPNKALGHTTLIKPL
ncbi:MAG: hypothetical protein ACK41O_12495 [Runella zeae]